MEPNQEDVDIQARKSQELPNNFDNTPKNGEDQFNQYFLDLEKWIEDTRKFFSPIDFATNITFNSDGSIQLPRQTHAYECQIASIWKRLIAEIIDGFILFLVKFYIIIILRDGFDITLKHYLAYLENPSMFFNFTTEIALVECISRIIIFMYESYFLYTDGATPGKKIMGLRVYTVERIFAIPDRNTVSAWPCKPLGWWRAFIRTVLKNIGLFVFPICYGIMITNPRAGYDHVTNTFVVDISQTPLRLITEDENIPQAPNNNFF